MPDDHESQIGTKPAEFLWDFNVDDGVKTLSSTNDARMLIKINQGDITPWRI